jgi:hypothetical protein
MFPEDDLDLGEMNYEMAEGESEYFGQDQGDDFVDFGDEFEDGLAADAGDDFGEDYGEDELGEGLEDDFEDEGFGEDEDETEADIRAMENAVVLALESDNADEFFSKLKKFAQRAGKVIGKAGRFAAPLLSKIPHPYAQAAAQVARVAGMLRAEGATEEEALDVFAEMAKRDTRALPVVAGLAARVVTRGKTSQMSRPARQRLVRAMTSASRQITQRHGPKATPAMAKVVKSVARNASGRPVSTAAKVKMVRRAAAKVAQNRRMVAKLARSPNRARRIARTVLVPTVNTYPLSGNGQDGSRPRSFRTAGPSLITVTPL